MMRERLSSLARSVSRRAAPAAAAHGAEADDTGDIDRKLRVVLAYADGEDGESVEGHRLEDDTETGGKQDAA